MENLALPPGRRPYGPAAGPGQRKMALPQVFATMSIALPWSELAGKL